MAKWELPAQWRQAIQSPSGNGETLLLSEGPPKVNREHAWSSMRLVVDPLISFQEVWLNLSVEDQQQPVLVGNARIRCRELRPQATPIVFEIEQDWTVDVVTIVGSGRQISVGRERELTIWPSPGDIVDGELVLDFHGRRNLDRRRRSIPSTWMVRPKDSVTPQVTAIHPPKRRRWDGNSVMVEGRIDSSQLQPDAVEFLQPDSEALLIRHPFDGSVEVTLEPNETSYSVSLRHRLEIDNRKVIETIVVRSDTPNPDRSLNVLTGTVLASSSNENAAEERDPAFFRWSLRRIDSSLISGALDATVEVNPDESTQNYNVRLDDRSLHEYELVGQRTYQIDGTSFNITLPGVLSATAQSAETSLPSDWNVLKLPPSVQLVPSAKDDGHRLRYASGGPKVGLRRTADTLEHCLVWKQTLDVSASSRGEDIFLFAASVSSKNPIFVSFDSDLELVSATLNGARYPVELRDGKLRIEPERQTDQIVVTIRRRHTNAAWVRRCLLPRVSIDGHILRRSVSCTASEGSILLGSLPGFPSMSWGDDRGFNGRKGWMLIHRNVALALGWLLCATLFCISWSIARWLPHGSRILTVMVVVSMGAAVVWWPM
ncbi:MAG: hypothetical protein AAF497_24800, partial [Planctomycetota bacterium]